MYLLLLLLIPVIWILLRRSFASERTSRQKISIGSLRSLLILIVALALSDPVLIHHSDQVNAFFCLDVSESISAEQGQAAHKFIRESTAKMDTEDQAGVIIFAKQPSLDVSLRKQIGSVTMRSDVSPNFTNIHDALQLAIGKFPMTGKNKIVLFTDGNQNLGDGVDMAHLAASLGVEIYPVPLAAWFGDSEIFVKKLETPSHMALDTPFEIKLVVVGSSENEAELVLIRNDNLLVQQTIRLQDGTNTITFSDALPEPGLYMYRAIVNTAGDTYFQNNEGLSFTRGTRKSRILYLTDETEKSQHLAAALQVQGLNVDQKSIRDISGMMHGFFDYNAVVLDNISGRSLSFATMEQIEKYVKDMGGGLVMIGGDQSFGAGYYKKTPVERTLPVFMDVPTDIKLSELVLVFIIDKSSSMMASYADKTKLEIAKIAAFSSIEMLNPIDNVGIVAFDTDFEWTVPITAAGERRKIADKLSRLAEGGGTDLHPALEEVYRVLNPILSARRHVVVLSDGETEEADFQSLAQSMGRSGISISTVAIGAGAHVALMDSLAQWGNGRSYFTDDPNTIPKIFTGETRIISKRIITEKTMQPILRGTGELLQGIDENLPVIYGQVVTYPKSGARVLMETARGPLLAVWQYGLGRSVAFTSDLSSRWGKNWVRWEHYGKFCAQMVKWAQRKEAPKRFMTTIDRTGEKGRFAVDITTDRSQFVNHLELKVNVLLPSGEDQTSMLDQTAPGRYEAIFPAEDIGAYYFSVFGNPETAPGISRVFGFGIPHTEEFNSTGVNKRLLQRLASITNGRVLSIDRPPDDLFSANFGSKESGTELWPYLVGLFLLFLVVDVGARKVLNLGQM
jgi:uncharacterized membrane protein